jgi:tetratricopeptide (TPR) repeat protein
VNSSAERSAPSSPSSPWRRGLGLALLVLLVLSTPSAHGADENLPTSAAQETPGGEEPTNWAPVVQSWAKQPIEARLLVRQGILALRDGDSATAEKKLRHATLVDPCDAEAWLWLARVHLRDANPAALEDLMGAGRAVVNDFRRQSRLGSRLLLRCDMVLVGSFLWIVLILLLRFLPFFHHQLRSWTKGAQHVEGRDWLLWIPALAPLSLGLGLLPSLCLATLLIWLYSGRRERVVLAVFLLFFSAQGFSVGFSLPLVGVRESSGISLLEKAANQSPDLSVEHALARSLRKLPHDPDLLFARGLLRARQGNFEASAADFRQVLALRPDDPKATNNLANDHYFLGEYDRAVAGYQHSAALDSLQGSTHYNLAQAYIKKLFFKESGEQMQLASRAGFELGSGGNRLPTGVVAYQSPDQWQSWRIAWSECDDLKPLDFLTPWRRWIGVPTEQIRIWLAATLLLSLLLMKIFPREKLVFECANCGNLSCPSCSGEHDGNVLCPGCFGTARRARSEMVLSTLLRNRRRSTEFRFHGRVQWLNAWLIGAGDLYSGLRKRGIVLTILAAGCLLEIPWPTALLPDPWQVNLPAKLLALPRVVAAVCLVLLFLYSRYGRSSWRSRSFHLHPASMVRLADLMDGHSEKKLRA